MNFRLIYKIILTCWSTIGQGQESSYGPEKGPPPGERHPTTWPSPPRVNRNPMRYEPAVALPPHPENHRWRIKSALKGGAPIFLIIDERQPALPVGQLPSGQEIELKELMGRGSRMFFSYATTVTIEGRSVTGTYWIDGNHIEYAGRKDVPK